MIKNISHTQKQNRMSSMPQFHEDTSSFNICGFSTREQENKIKIFKQITAN